MPIYSHKCVDCACVTTTEYSIKEDPEIPCEVCQGPTKRIIQAANFVLTGDGWMKDGYGTKHKKG